MGTFKALESKAEIAMDTFATMFRGQLANDDFLLSDSEDEVLQAMREKFEELDTSRIHASQIVRSLDECSSLLMDLTAQQNDGGSNAIWPYIRKIRLVFRYYAR